MQILRRSPAGPGRTSKQEQEQISPNHVQAFFPSSVFQRSYILRNYNRNPVYFISLWIICDKHCLHTLRSTHFTCPKSAKALGCRPKASDGGAKALGSSAKMLGSSMKVLGDSAKGTPVPPGMKDVEQVTCTTRYCKTVTKLQGN